MEWAAPEPEGVWGSLFQRIAEAKESVLVLFLSAGVRGGAGAFSFGGRPRPPFQRSCFEVPRNLRS